MVAVHLNLIYVYLRNEKTRMSLALWNPSRRWSECLWPSKILGEPTNNHRDFPTWLRYAIENMCKQMLPQKPCRTCFIASGPWTGVGGCVSAFYNLGRAFFAPEKEQRSKTIEEKFQDVVLDEGRKGAHLRQSYQHKIFHARKWTHLSNGVSQRLTVT